MKKLIATLLSLTLLITAAMVGVFSLPVGASEDYDLTDGVFKYSIFLETKTAEIFSFCGSGGDVVVPTTFRGFPVKSIGFAAFMGKTNITSITIPEGVTIIKDCAFQYCSNLTSVTLPNSLTSIGSDAFAYCNKSIDIHISGLSQWLDCTFETPSSTPTAYDLYIGKEKLTKLVVPSGVTAINKYQFEGCTSITTLKLPRTLTRIGVHAFRDCKNIQSVYVSNLVSWCNVSFDSAGGVYYNPLSVAENLYVNGKLVTDLVIPDGVTSIKAETFAGTSAISSLTIPQTVKTIGDGAFANCKNLTSVTITSGLKTLPKRLFANCSNLKTITIPSSVTKIEEKSFEGCENITSVYLANLEKWCAMSFGDEYSSPLRCAKKVYVNKKLTTSLVIPSTIKRIKQYTFSNCSAFIKLTIPKSVTTIDSGAFLNCSKLTTVTLPSSLTTVGNSAFAGCTGIKTVNIFDLKAWCKIAFDNETANPLYFADSLVLNQKKLTQITIPSGVTKIGDYAFRNYGALKKVTIPSGVKTIGKDAFSGCTVLTSVSLGEGVKTIEEKAFYGCTELPSITIPASVTSVKSEAFAGCSTISSVKIADLKAWCNISFENGYANPLCYANNLLLNGKTITQLTVPKGVATIGSCTFYNYDKLEKVSISSTVKTIGDSAFFSCTALIAVSGGSNVKTVERCAFAWCENLAKETILDTTVVIGKQAFGQTALSKVVIAKGVETIEDYAFYACKELVDVSIPYGVTTIGEEAFEHCTGLTQVDIPRSVTKIGNGAFWGCSNLAKLVLSKNTTSYGLSAFGYIDSVPLTVWYSGSKADREQLNLTYNSGLNYATWHYNTCEPKHSYTNSCDKTCNKCEWKRTIKHTYSNDCDKSCNVCKATRTVSGHTYKKVVTKATQTKNGKIKDVCSKCGYTSSKATTICKASKISLSETIFTYNGKAQKPSVVIKDSMGKTIAKSNYTVTYSSGRKNVGKYKVTVKMKGNYTGTKTLFFKINPAKTTVKSLTAGKKSLKVAIAKKSTQVTGYQIQYSTSKKFTNVKTKWLTSYKKTSLTLSGLSAKKTYYVRVRTYKIVNGVKYYSGWSSIKYKKTK